MVRIGVVTKSQGIKGEVKVMPDDEVGRYLKLKSVFIDGKEKQISSISARRGFLYVSFEGINSRESSDLLKGKEIFAKSENVFLEDNEYYFKDLIGAVVLDETGGKIGEVVDIEQYGAADVITIRERNILFAVPFIDSIFNKILPDIVVVNRNEYDNNKV